MKTIQPGTLARGKRGVRGFTIIELMISVLILALLLGLLIGGVKMATRTTKGVVDKATVQAIRDGASHFRVLFEFNVPLVRDQDPEPPNPRQTIEPDPANRTVQRVSVHKPSDTDYLDDLRGEELATFRTTNNPLADYRLSEKSLPIYLVGQLEVPLYKNHADGVSIDGIPGPGFCRPNPDGSFATEWVNPTTGKARTGRTGQTFQALVNVGGSAPKLFVDPADVSKVALQDRQGVAIRYYRWEHDDNVAASGSVDFTKLNVPFMVGRLATDIPGFNPPDDRDLTKNTSLRSATFAIVAAGPDGVFGDEPLIDICQKLGIALDPSKEVAIRIQAEKDNIVEVGQ